MTNFNRREFLAGAAGLVAGGLVGQAGIARAQVKAKPGDRDLLVVVDVQNDFIPGGALPVKEGDQIVPLINTIAAKFTHVILTQDWHTPGHTSFASAHGGKKPFETVTLVYGTQVLWPDHCVQGTPGADFHRDLKIPHAELIIRKGYRQHIDSYSAFFEADKSPRAHWREGSGLRQSLLRGFLGFRLLVGPSTRARSACRPRYRGRLPRHLGGSLGKAGGHAEGGQAGAVGGAGDLARR
jgi:nicotinamidase-related amidase